MKIELSGHDTATCGNMSVKNINAPLCKLARKMVASGVSEDTLVGVFRGATRCFKDLPLSHWAGLSVSEGDNSSARFVPYVPFSGIAS